jgi:hypothetical protein
MSSYFAYLVPDCSPKKWHRDCLILLFCFVKYLNHPWSVCPILLRVVSFHDSWNHLLNRLFILLFCPLLMQPSKLHLVLLCTCRCCKLCVLLGFLVEGRLFICICQVMSWVGHRTHLSFEFVNQLIFSLLYFPLLPFAYATGLQLERV